MSNTPSTPNGASSAFCGSCTPSGTASGSADERAAIIEVELALRRIDEHYQPSEDEIAAAAGVTTADVRGILEAPRCGSFGTFAVAEDADE